MSHKSEIRTCLAALAKAGWTLTACSRTRGLSLSTIMKAVYQRPYAIDLVFTHADGRKSWLVLHPQTGDDSCIIADWGAGEDDFRDTIDEVVLQNDPDAIIDDLVRN